MQKKKIILIAILISLSLVGLVSIQLYWVNNAIRLKEQEFQNEVFTALRNVVSKLEQIETYNGLQKYQKTYGHYLNADSLGNFIASQAETMVNEIGEFIVDTPNSIKKIMKQNDIQIEIAIDSTQKKSHFISEYQTNADSINAQINQWIKKSHLVHEIVRDIATLNASYSIEERIKPALMDSLLKAELQKQHIITAYSYNIYDPSKQRLLLASENMYNPGDLLSTPYRVDLFPNDIFKKPYYLLIDFPNKKQFLLSEMWILFSVSTIIVLIISFSFLFIILTLIRQKKLSDIKNDFINNMTHELKTPIATISLACEVLNDTAITKNQDMVNNYINVIDQENKRLAKLVENVLQTSVIEKGEFKLHFKEIDLHEVVNEAIKNINVQIQKKKGVLTTKLEAAPSIIQADRFHLINVINNLIDNAIKYSSEQLLIEIETRNYKDGLILSIRDNGIGMNKETQKKVFDKFYRATTGNVHDVKGFGLGLSYVKAVVEMHKGKIELESAPEAGSKFELYLPYLVQASL